ncbi:MAG: CDP-alcohol phosphatidyltransferase family protein [Thermoleophilaceae bacterium]|nr:CDP-alcohol phosphatidyltransferase family protein [Thermoleophilaceae bacterium]
MARTPLTFRRLSGLDRSGPPPPETVEGAPLRPWTIPNAIGYVRLALIPVYLVLAFSSGDGRDTTAAIIYAAIAGGDYLDGIAARVTGQYSRLGALLDPLVDRMLVVSGVVVCWHFELLPRLPLGILAARELVMLVLSQIGLRKGIDLKINYIGRWAVWPTMFALFLAMLSTTWIAEASLWLGLGMTLIATGFYFREGYEKLRPPSSGA